MSLRQLAREALARAGKPVPTGTTDGTRLEQRVEQAASSLFHGASSVEQSEQAILRSNANELSAADGPVFHVPRPRVGTVERGATLVGKAGTADGTRLERDALPVIDKAEREAVATELGQIPEAYATAFAAIQSCPPADVPRRRWNLFIDDAGIFIDRWGKQADRLGWSVEDLFGLHPTAGLNRHDAAGLCWLLKSQRVVALTTTEARLSGGLAYYRWGKKPA